MMEDTSTPPVMEDESFLEYLNTALGEKVPNLTVLQVGALISILNFQEKIYLEPRAQVIINQTIFAVVVSVQPLLHTDRK